jgi:hypothetical protein
MLFVPQRVTLNFITCRKYLFYFQIDIFDSLKIPSAQQQCGVSKSTV